MGRYQKNSKKGETLVETLVGMLIVVMASSVLVGGISTALRINKKTADLRESTKFDYSDSDGTKTSGSLVITGLKKVEKSGQSEILEPITVTIETHDCESANGYTWFEP